MTRFANRPSGPTESQPGSGLTPRSGDVTASFAPSATPDQRIARTRSPADAMQPVAVMTASWSCSVGSTWTVVLHTSGLTTRPNPTAWISSGVPITEPAPESLARTLLAEHGFQLFSDADDTQRTRSVHRFGFVSRNAELILLAEIIRDETIGYPERPLALAARWTAAGFSAKTALSWLRSGTLSPEAGPHSDHGRDHPLDPDRHPRPQDRSAPSFRHHP